MKWKGKYFIISESYSQAVYIMVLLVRYFSKHIEFFDIKRDYFKSPWCFMIIDNQFNGWDQLSYYNNARDLLYYTKINGQDFIDQVLEEDK